MAYNILKLNNPIIKDKFLGLDYDWTLVCPKTGLQLPKDINDWTFLYSNMKDKLKEFCDSGFMIVIFTNQTKAWKVAQIQTVLNQLEIPMFVVISLSKELNKPNKELYLKFLEYVELVENNIKLDKSIFVGDALGRKCDFSDCDKKFAENIGIEYMSPELCFYIKNNEYKFEKINRSVNKEIIIMVGYPGSGKSSYAKHIENELKYIHLEKDVIVTIPKILKMIEKNKEKGFIVDATNGSKKSRAVLIEFAKKHNFNVRCVYVTTSRIESIKRCRKRELCMKIIPIPPIAFSIYDKYFEMPELDEGIDEIIIIK